MTWMLSGTLAPLAGQLDNPLGSTLLAAGEASPCAAATACSQPCNAAMPHTASQIEEAQAARQPLEQKRAELVR